MKVKSSDLFKSMATILAVAMVTGQAAAPPNGPHAEFQTSDRCLACHNGMTTKAAEDYSIGLDWSTSLMANASRDPYWQASLRRETLEHSEAAAAIENECSACHMPIPQYLKKERGQLNPVFDRLPLHPSDKESADGVSCSVCHQITSKNLGTSVSFNGSFIVDPPLPGAARPEYGPYAPAPGMQQVMRTSTGGYQPQLGDQIRTAELCASCHTLTTEARGANGQVIGSLPEQRPYQEWLHSDFRRERTCQSCHMPAVHNEVPITRILGVARPGAARHQFVAANFVMQRILGRYHDDLDVSAEPQELFSAADRTIRYLQSEAATLAVTAPNVRAGRVEADVTVKNLGGHKLPTAFPARRAWLHVVLRDGAQHILFESGALNTDGSIAGNVNDKDPTKYEPHYSEIRSADQVQIYEAILGDQRGRVTTGLLAATDYLKDNRLLPRGFDKHTASGEVAVHGEASADPGFTDRGHTLRYSVVIGNAAGPFNIDVELWYQPIGYRWAENLKAYNAQEIEQFTRYFDRIGAGNAVMLVKASSATPGETN